MNDLRISLVQGDTRWRDPAGNREYYGRLIAPLHGITDLVLLPETFTSGFSNDAIDEAETMDGPTVAWMRDQAGRLGAGLSGGVELRADTNAQPLLPGSTAASEDDYAAEFLDLVLAVRVVDDLEAAIAHIRAYTSDHTEVIATEDAGHAERFVNALRSAVVMVNASSRFSDGGQLGLGSEIGISTTRLHAYGPMGLEALTVERFVVRGEGQTRK